MNMQIDCDCVGGEFFHGSWLATRAIAVRPRAVKLILASASPRRHELLAQAGVQFEVVVSPAAEIHDSSIPLAELCEQNAELKARAVAEAYPEATVIGADTLVWIDGEPLGKPRDFNEAREMLRKLSGRNHTVCTGVCVVVQNDRDFMI
jgi:septum formation protein